MRGLILLSCLSLVSALTISITSTVVIGQNTPVSWQRSHGDAQNFDLFVNDVDIQMVQTDLTSSRSGQTSITMDNQWTPGRYQLIAQFWEDSDNDPPDAVAEFTLVEASPSSGGGTTTVTDTHTQTGTQTNSHSSSSSSSPQATTSSKSSSSPGTTSSTSHRNSSTAATTIGSSNSPSSTLTSADTSTALNPPSSSPPVTTTASQKSQSKVPIIVGCVVAIAVILILILLLWLVYHRRRRNSTKASIVPYPVTEMVAAHPAPLGATSSFGADTCEIDLISEGGSSAALIPATTGTHDNVKTAPYMQSPTLTPVAPSPLAQMPQEQDLVDLNDPQKRSSIAKPSAPELLPPEAAAEIYRLRSEIEQLRDQGRVSLAGTPTTGEAPPAYMSTHTAASLL